MAIVTLRYWAAAKEAAGVAEETVRAQTLAAALAAGLAAAADRARSAGFAVAGSAPAGSGVAGACVAGPSSQGLEGVEKFRLVLARSSFLIDGNPVGTRSPDSVTLSDAAVIEVLPPFAGG